MEVLIASSTPASTTTGVGSVESNLIRLLRANGVGVRTFFPPKLGNAVATDFFYGSGLKAGKFGADLVHAHSDISWNCKGAVRTWHGNTTEGRLVSKEEGYTLMKPWFSRGYFASHIWLERQCAKNNHAIAVSGYLKQKIMEHYGKDPNDVSVIYVGVDEKRFGPNDGSRRRLRASLGVCEKDFLALWVGHKEFNKGLRYLLKVIEATRDNPDVKFALVGSVKQDDPALIGLSTRARSKIVFAGKTSQIEDFHNASDAFLLTSVFELMPQVVVEALSCGRPVLAFAHTGGHEEAIESDCGILVEPRDTAAMADALLKLAQDERLRVRLGKRGREKVLERFTAGKMIRDHIVLYSRLCAKA